MVCIQNVTKFDNRVLITNKSKTRRKWEYVDADQRKDAYCPHDYNARTQNNLFVTTEGGRREKFCDNVYD